MSFLSAAAPRFRRGIALIIVLGFIGLLSVLITGLMETLRVRLIEGEQTEQRATLRASAESAIAVLQGRLARYESDQNGIYLNSGDIESIAADPLAGWAPTDGSVVTVKVRDESGLFSINTTNTTTLSGLFRDLGLGEDRAAMLADCLADWIDADSAARAKGAEDDAYGVPGLPANRKLRSFNELRRVKGFEDAFFEADGAPSPAGVELASVITFLDTGTGPNINTAPESVLNLLSMRSGVDISGILSSRTPLNYPDERTHSSIFKNAGDLVRISAPPEFGPRVTYASRGIRVTVTAAKGDIRYVIDTILSASTTNRNIPIAITRRSDQSLLGDEGLEVATGSSAVIDDPSN